jgi:hypothetical protein
MKQVKRINLRSSGIKGQKGELHATFQFDQGLWPRTAVAYAAGRVTLCAFLLMNSSHGEIAAALSQAQQFIYLTICYGT